MKAYSEENIEAAISDILDGIPIRQAAKRHGVPRQTISNRILAQQPASNGHEHRQRLSPVQEKRLAQWILAQESLGYAPTHTQVRSFVTRLLARQGDVQPLGRNWFVGFFSQKP